MGLSRYGALAPVPDDTLTQLPVALKVPELPEASEGRSATVRWQLSSVQELVKRVGASCY